MVTSLLHRDHTSKPWHKVWPRHLRYSLDYPDVPAWWILERNIGQFDHRDAVIFLNHEDMREISRCTYLELYNSTLSLAAGLVELGIKKGDRVAVVLPNSPALIRSYYGIWLAGATIVPNNPMAKKEELRKTFVNSEVKMVIAVTEILPQVMEAIEGLHLQIIAASTGRSHGMGLPKELLSLESLLKTKRRLSDIAINPSEDLAVILYTGGTTGEPKGAMLTHRNIVVNTI